MPRDADRLLSEHYQVRRHFDQEWKVFNFSFLTERLNKTETSASQWPSMDEPESEKSEESTVAQDNSDNNVNSKESEQLEVLVQI